METKELLRSEIDRVIKEMGNMNIDSAEYKTAAETVAKLIDRYDELDKTTIQWSAQTEEDARQEAELNLKREQLEIQWSAQTEENARQEAELNLKREQLEHEKKIHEDDEAFKEKQVKEERRKMIVNIVLTSLGIIIPTGVTIWGTYKTLKFEETGTITTAMGRGFIQRLFPKK